MFRITIASVLLLAVLIGTASAAPLFPLSDPALDVAAERLRQRDYRGALDQAQMAKEGVFRNFVIGEAAFRLERFDEAVPPLTAAAAGFPLLADYALLRRAQALANMGNHAEALASARAVMKEYPDSILLREAHFLAADSLFRLGQMQAAREALRSFVEKYPSGSDSLKASYLAALALVQGGDQARGAAELRTLWLANPASPLADDAGNVLKGLPPDILSPYTTDELFRRALALYDSKKYSDAIQQMESLVKSGVSPELAGRIRLKLGQAQFRLRRYTDAQTSFAQTDRTLLKKEQQEELAYWQARLLEKSGKGPDTYSAYLRLAIESPASPYADNALFEAAAGLKSLGKTVEAGQLFSQLVQSYPDSTFRSRAAWEAGWERLAAGEPKTAADYFQILTASQETSEQGFFWLSKALDDAGEKERAAEIRGRLLRDYPYGYYALVASGGAADSPLPTIAPLDLATELPMPPGMERIKALITLGLAPEARKELSRLKGKGKPGKPATDRAIARLYLELGDYASAMRLFQKTGSKMSSEEGSFWSITHPVPFREAVTLHAAKNRLNQELVYAVMRAESSFSPTVVSPAGAMGLMQLMPATAKAMKPSTSLKTVTSLLTMPEYNISLGTRHLRELIDQYEGDEALAVAAYNAGGGNVNRWIRSIGTKNREAFIEQIPFPETRAYVKKVLAGAAIYRGLYGKGIFSPPPSPLVTPPATPAPLPSDELEESEEAHPSVSDAIMPASQS